MSSKFLLCIRHGGHPESLEPRKFYEVLDDPQATAEKMVRVIDESGEDYLHPRSCFIEVPLSSTVKRHLRSA